MGWTVESESVKPLCGDDEPDLLRDLSLRNLPVLSLCLTGLGASETAYLTVPSMTDPVSSLVSSTYETRGGFNGGMIYGSDLSLVVI